MTLLVPVGFVPHAQPKQTGAGTNPDKQEYIIGQMEGQSFDG